MSTYTISDTVDLFSTTAPGQANLFNTAGTFSVQLKAPAAVTSYAFSLPPTVGTTGQICQLTSATTLQWITSPTPTTVSFPAARRYYASSATQLSTTSTVNVVADHFLFGGTSIPNNSPITILAILGASIASTTTCDVTITDITNSTTIILSSQPGFTNANAVTRRVLGTPSNLSAGPAIWQVLIKRTAGTGTIYFYELQVVGDYFLY